MLRALTFASPDPPEMTLQSVTCKVNEYSLVNVAVFAADDVGEDVVGDEVEGDDVVGEDVVGEEVDGDDVVGEEVDGDDVVGEDVVGEEVGRGWQFSGLKVLALLPFLVLFSQYKLGAVLYVAIFFDLFLFIRNANVCQQKGEWNQNKKNKVANLCVCNSS